MSAPGPWLSEQPAFITPDDLLSGALQEITTYFANSRDYLQDLCVSASQTVEDQCERRLLPFTDLIETDVLDGVSTVGSFGDGEPLLGMSAALGLSEARAFGATGACRDLQLSHYPPRRAELWAYTACSVALTYPWGTSSGVLAPGSFVGPMPDTGQIRLNVGVLSPPGTIYTATYSGGYLYGIPGPLREAARWTAIRQLLLEVEPEQRTAMSLGEVDQQIITHLAGYAR